MKHRFLHKTQRILLIVALGVLNAISAQVNFTINNIPASTGDIAEIPVTVNNFTDVVGFQLQAQIPEDKAEFIGLESIHPELTGFKEANYRYVGNGIINIIWADLQFNSHTIEQGETLFIIKVKITTTNREAFTIDFTSSKAANGQGAPITTSTTPGSISVGALQLLVEDDTVGVGTVIEIPVRAKNFIDVAGFQNKIQFNSEFAGFIALKNINPALTGFGEHNYFSPEPGVVNVVWDESGLVNTTIDDEEILFAIQLRIGNNAATFPIEIKNVNAFDNQPEPILSVDTSATISIVEFVAVSGTITNEEDEGITDVTVSLRTPREVQSIPNMGDGTFSFTTLPGKEYVLVPEKNTNITTGINVADILIIRKHLLGNELLDSPYKIVAADVDNSAIVDVADIISLRKFILGTTDTLDKNWSFIPKEFTFSDPSNPFGTSFPMDIKYSNLTEDQIHQDFIGIKTGDVNNDHDPTNKNSENTSKLIIQEMKVFSGNTIKVPVTVENGYTNIAGWQSTIEFNQNVLSFSGVEAGQLLVSASNLGMHLASEGKINFLYDQNKSKGETITSTDALFYLIFEVVGKAGDQSEIRFTNGQIPMMTFDENLIQGKLIAKTATIQVEELNVDVYPNPGTNFTIQVTLPSKSNVSIKITNFTGKIIVQEEKMAKTGMYTFNFDASTLAKGIYFMECTVGSEHSIQKLMVN